MALERVAPGRRVMVLPATLSILVGPNELLSRFRYRDLFLSHLDVNHHASFRFVLLGLRSPCGHSRPIAARCEAKLVLLGGLQAALRRWIPSMRLFACALVYRLWVPTGRA